MADANVNAPGIAEEVVAAVEEEMAAERAALLASFGRFGYNVATSTAIVDSLNLRVPGDLAGHSDKTLRNLADQLLKKYAARRAGNANVNIPLTVFNDLNTYKLWALERKRQGLPAPAEEFDDNAIATARDRVLELELLEEAAALVEVGLPTMFKGVEKGLEFDQSFDHHCSRVRGMSGIPIIYVYREHEVVTEAIRTAQYATRDDYLIATTILTGSHYKADNNRVYDLLKDATKETMAETYVKPFDRARDGRGAVIALRRHCGAPSTLEARSATANKTISTTKYRGVSRNFTIADYNAKFADAFDELDKLGEGLAPH
jgi:hypothetical protein